MSHSMLKKFSLSLAALVVAASASAAEQSPLLSGASRAGATAFGECSARQEIDRGWEYQRGLLEGRLEAKYSGPLEVKGAIISPPLPGFTTPQRATTGATDSSTKTAAPIEHRDGGDSVTGRN